MKTAPTIRMTGQMALILLLTGCASDQAFREGERLLAAGRTQEGMQQLEKAMLERPHNAQIRTAYLRSKEHQIQSLLVQAESHRQASNWEAAAAAFQAALKLHPENTRALSGLVGIETSKRNRALLESSEASIKQGEFEMARHKARMVLAQEPTNEQALVLLKTLDEREAKPQGVAPLSLDAKFRRAITLEFRDAPIRSVFDAVSRQSGLNFIFDKDVRTDARTTIYARDTAILDAVDMLLSTSQLNRKVLSGNTLLIYPNQPAKQREYQDLVVKSFFLGNADVKTTLNMVKTLARSRDVFIDEKLNLLVVRDTPEAVRLIEKLISVQDRADSEVMLEVEILEVKRSRMQDLGVQWPTQLSLLNVPPASSVTTSPGGVTTVTTPAATSLTLNSLYNLNSGAVAINSAAANLKKDASDVNILANPRIRVKNREKAKVHIGDKVPVITANTTSTGVVSETVAYLDVGLKLDVEPLVHLEGDVGIKVGLEVSNIVREIRSTTGTLTYQIGSRNANTVLRLKDGETQVLAGLISDEDRKGANKVPGFGDLPLLGRLFSSQRDELAKTEIVLLITPRVIRNIERPELNDAEFFAGTEAVAGDQPQRIRPPSPGVAGGSASARSRPGRAPVLAIPTQQPQQQEAADSPDAPAQPVTPENSPVNP